MQSATLRQEENVRFERRYAILEWAATCRHNAASWGCDGLTIDPRLIEVKTTNGWERTPFHLSRNELAVADERRADWCLFRLWNFSREPKAFELRPPLDAHVSLTATAFQASFH